MDTTKNLVAKTSDQFEALGKIAWLWMNSPLHAKWPIDLLTKFAIPPIERQQFLILERAGVPVAYCSWAHMDRQAESRYILDATKLPLEDWNCGDRLWFIDWIAPFSRQDSMDMKNILSEKFAYSLARAVRVKKTNTKARVMEFKGKLLPKEEAKQKLDQYFQEFVSEREQLKKRVDNASLAGTPNQ